MTKINILLHLNYCVNHVILWNAPCPEKKSLQYSIILCINKFRYSFIICGINHPDTPMYWKFKKLPPTLLRHHMEMTSRQAFNKSFARGKHHTACQLLKEFPNKNWSGRGLNHFLQKVDKFGSVGRRVGSGHCHSTRTVETIDAVADLVHSQDDQPHSHLAVRQLSHEINIPRSSVSYTILSNKIWR